MTRPPLSNTRRRTRRPPRATILAFVALPLLIAALVAPPAALAQEIDPLAAVDQTIDAGSVAVPMDVEADLQHAIESGGVPAVLELQQEPAPPPAPSPASEPQSDLLPAPTTGMPSETAPGPAPESQPTLEDVEVAEPPAPVAPINLNVDIRILSPGDNGAVTQEMTVPGWSGQAGGGAQGQPLAWTWNWTWNWNWTTPAVDDDPAMGEVLLGEVLGTGAPGDPGQLFVDAPAEQPAPAQPQHVAPPPPAADHPSPSRRDAVPPASIDPRRSSFGGSMTDSPPTVPRSSADATSAVTEAARATLSRRQPARGEAPAPKQAPPALPSAAASSVGGGSGAPFVAAVLGLLCLLAPRALELARAPHTKLSSQLSSSRLERPG